MKMDSDTIESAATYDKDESENNQHQSNDAAASPVTCDGPIHTTSRTFLKSAESVPKVVSAHGTSRIKLWIVVPFSVQGWSFSFLAWRL
jgi:hypothetical protein